MASSNRTVFDLVLNWKQFVEDTKNVSKNWKRMGQDMTSVGRDLTFALSAPLALITKNSLDTARAFDLAVRKLQGLSGPSVDITPLIKQARELGATTVFTALEVAELQLSLRRLGQSDKEIAQITPVVLKLSLALGSDLATSGEFAVQTINRMGKSFEGFTDQAAKAEYVAQVFAIATKESSLTSETLRTALNYVGAEANAAGLRLSEVSAILAVLAKNGYTGSRAGTQLRRIFAELTKEGKDVSKEFFDIVKSGVSFEQALDRVGIRAAGTFAALSGNTEEMFRLIDAFDNGADVVDYLQEQIEGGLDASFRKVTSSAEEMYLSFNEATEPMTRLANDIIISINLGLAEMSPAIKRAVFVMGGLVAILPVVTIYAGLYTKAVAAATQVTATFGTVMRVAIPALTILSTIFVVVAGVMGQYKEKLLEANNNLQDHIDKTNELARTGDAFGAVAENFKKQDEAVQNLKNAQERLSSNTQKLLEIEEQKSAIIENAKTKLISYSTGYDIATTVIKDYTDEEKEALRVLNQKLELLRNENNQLNENIALSKQVIDFTNNYLSVNEDLVSRYLAKQKSEAESIKNLKDLTTQYNDLTKKITTLRNEFKENGGNLEEYTEKLKASQEELDALVKLFELFGIKVPGVDEDINKNAVSISKLQAEYAKLTEQIERLTSGDVINFNQLDKLKARLSEIEGLLTSSGRGTAKAKASSFQDLVDQYIQAQLQLKTLSRQEPLDLGKIEKTNEKLELLRTILNQLNVDLSEQTGTQEWLDDQADIEEKYSELIRSVTRGVRDITTSADEQESSIRSITDQIQDFIDANEDWVNSDATKEIFGDMSQYIDAVRKKLQDYYDDLNKTNLLTQQMAYANYVGEFASSWVIAFGEAAMGARSMGEVIQDVLKQILQKVIALTVAWLVLNAISLGGARGATGASGFGSYLQSGILGNLSFSTFATNNPIKSISGAISGSNLIITEQRGITAYDRTYG